MNIIKEIVKFVKGEEVDTDSLPTMPRDLNAAYIQPVCVPGSRNAPRMTYRR